MRTKIHDDLYMRAYQFSDRDEDDEPVSGWKSVLAATAKKTFGRVKPFKPEYKNKSAISKREPEKSAIDNSQGVTSMSQALQYASRGGAAPALAKTRAEPAESRESVAERR